MPLSELYRVARGKFDSIQDKNNNMVAADLSLNSGNDVLELVYENGQVLLQGQSSRTRRNSNLNTSQAQCLPSHSPRDRDRDVGHFNNAKMEKFGAIDSVVRDVVAMPPSPGIELGNDDDDDMVPWLNYPFDGHLQHDFSSDFLPELSGVTVNDIPSRISVASSIDKASGGNQVNRHTHNSLHSTNLEDGNISKLSSFDVLTARPRSSTNQLHSSGSLQRQTSLPHLRTKSTGGTKNTKGKALHDSLMGHSPHVPLIVKNSSSTARQKLDPTPPSNSSKVINFSHFLRSAAVIKSNVQNNDVTGAVDLSGIRSVGSMDKNCSAANSKPHDSSLFGTRGRIRKQSNPWCQNAVVGPSIDDNNPSDAKPPEQSQVVKQPEVACLGDSAKNNDHPKQCHESGATKGLPDNEKAVESVIASSVCSRTSVEGASDDPTFVRKRKCHEPEDSEWHSDDVEENVITLARGSGSKRSRATEVHNLSERRRRDRINEKMRALQELIPNCNKVDKASMLDEVIEYLKTLQLQVQFMSMGSGLFMPPMMFPGGMAAMNAPHIYSPMGMGMGFGLGMPDMNCGSPGYPMVQMPHMQGTYFPGPSIPAQTATAMHGIPGSNFQLLGLPGQGHPMSVPRGPIAPFPGGPFVTNSAMAVAPMENFGLASSKDASPSMTSPMVRSSGNDPSITPALRQANELASCANGSGVNPTSKNDLMTN